MNSGSGTRLKRAQANLPVVAVALVVLTAVTGTAIAMAEGALVSADRDAAERAAAVAAADGLVAADASVTRRANVVDREALADLTPTDVEAVAPAVVGKDLRVRVGDRVILERGSPTGGTTVRRIALLATTDRWSEELATDGDSLTLPRRTTTVTIREVEGDVHTVRVDGRIVLHDPDGIDGETTVDVSRYETIRVTAEGEGASVTVVATPETTEKALLEVTVDA